MKVKQLKEFLEQIPDDLEVCFEEAKTRVSFRTTGIWPEDGRFIIVGVKKEYKPIIQWKTP